MTENVKLLLVHNMFDPPTSKFIIHALPQPRDPENPTFPGLTAYGIDIPKDLNSVATPAAVWDSARGLLLVALRTSNNGGQPALCTIRPGFVLGQYEKVISCITRVAPSMMFYQNNPILGTTINTNMPADLELARRDVSSSTPNTWLMKRPILSGNSPKSNVSPRLLRVGNELVYNFYMDSQNDKYIRFCVIDSSSFQNSWLVDTDRSKVYWSDYWMEAALSGRLGGWPALVLTGSSSTTRRIHIFVVNADKDLRYGYLPLLENGLPSVYPTTLSRQVPLLGEVRVARNVAGPVTAVVYFNRIFVFYVDNTDSKIRYVSRAIDGGNWSQSNTLDYAVSKDPGFGGLCAVVVQSDF
ncbi:hypothetical protein MMC11_005161 [Xylographa trunciseda]|nr:hypothetical protein [Xylographa trunciseda]